MFDLCHVSTALEGTTQVEEQRPGSFFVFSRRVIAVPFLPPFVLFFPSFSPRPYLFGAFKREHERSFIPGTLEPPRGICTSLLHRCIRAVAKGKKDVSLVFTVRRGAGAGTCDARINAVR